LLAIIKSSVKAASGLLAGALSVNVGLLQGGEEVMKPLSLRRRGLTERNAANRGCAARRWRTLSISANSYKGLGKASDCARGQRAEIYRCERIFGCESAKGVK
jgi:hypothetical protein